jgi:uncharacterized repeat protein (TIGR02543 family)
MTAPKVITLVYVEQCLITFNQTGVGSDFSGTIVIVQGVNYARVDLPKSFWFNKTLSVSFAFQSPLYVPAALKRYVWDSTSGGLTSLITGTIVVANPGAVVGNYRTQFNMTFAQDGLDSSASGTVVTVNGSTKSYGQLPYVAWVDNGKVLVYTYEFQVASSLSGKRFEKVGVAGPASPVTADSAKTVTGNYKTQYRLTVALGHDSPDPIVGDHWYDSGTNVTASVASPADESGGTRYRCTGWTGTGSVPGSGSSTSTWFFITSPSTIIWNWIAQYKLIVASAHDSPNPGVGDHWYDSGTNVTALVTSPAGESDGTRYRCTGWTGTGSVPPSGSLTSTWFLIASPSNITWNWVTQYYLTVVSAYDTPGGADWYDSGATPSATLVTGTVDQGNNTRRIFMGWTGDASGAGLTSGPITMDAPKTAIATWKTQYYFTVTSAHDSPTGEGWYDKGSNASSSVTSPFSGGVGVQYVATGYSGTGSAPSGSGTSLSFTINTASGITWNWNTQYEVKVDWSIGPDATGKIVTVTVDGTPYVKNGGDSFFDVFLDAGTTVSYSFEDTVASSVTGKRYKLNSVAGSSTDAAHDFGAISGAINETGNYMAQYEVIVTASPVGAQGGTFKVSYTHDGTPHSNEGHTTPWTEWADAGTNAVVSDPQDIISISGDSRYKFDHYDPSDTALMDQARTVTLVYKAQYLLTLTTNPPGIATPSGAGWYNDSDLAPISTDQYHVEQPDEFRYRFSGWTTDDMSEITNASATSTTVLMDKGKTVEANYMAQYKVRFLQFGLTPAATGTVVTVGGVPHPLADLPFLTNWLDTGTSLTYSYQATVGSTNVGEHFRLDHVDGPASPIAVTAYSVVTGNYVTQFYLTMTTTDGSVLPGSGWHDAGSHVTISASAPIAVAGERYSWLGWTGTGTGSYTGALNPAGIDMDGPITEAAAWTHEFRLIVASLYDSPDPAVGNHWYAVGTTINALVTSPAAGPSGTRYVCTGWTGSGSVPPAGNTTAVTFVIGAPSRITWNWKIQFYLNVSSAHGTVGGQGWYDPGTTAYALVTPLTAEDVGGIRYVFVNWTVDATGNTSPSDPIIMDRDKTAVANWDVELRLDVVSAFDSPYGAGWYKPGATANFGVITPVDLGNRTLLVFIGWSGDVNQTEPTGSIVMTKPSRVVASWIVQYLVTFNTTLPNGNRLTIPGIPQALPPGLNIFGAFYMAGSAAVGGPAPLITPGPDGTRYVFKGWDLDGVLLTPGVDFSFLVNAPHNASMVFDTEFLLVVNGTGVTAPFNATLTITASPPVPYQLSPISAVEEWFRKNAGLSLLISTPNKIGHGVWAIFKQWSGSTQSTDRSVSLVMSGPKTVNAIFFSTNPVAESLPYSIVAGLICFGLAYYMTRNKKGEQKGSTRITFGTVVVAIALLVAAIMSAMIATGFGINVAELPDLTNWAVLFLGAEALVLFYITHRFTKGGQPEQAQAAPETAKVPANPYGV